jgi:hypothetical protein
MDGDATHFQDNAVALISAYKIRSAVKGLLMKTHLELDARSLALHQLVVAKIRRDPKLFEYVLGTLERWRREVAAMSQPYVAAWRQAAAQGMEACLSLAEEDSPRGAEMRQSSPFVGILTPQERSQFFKEWRKR